MYNFCLLVLILTVVRHEVNARAVATKSFGLALSNASPYHAIEKKSVLPRQLYLTRDSSGCLIPVSKSPHNKRNVQTATCNECAATPTGNGNSIASILENSGSGNDGGIFSVENSDPGVGSNTFPGETSSLGDEKGNLADVGDITEATETSALDTGGTNSFPFSDMTDDRLEFAIKRPDMCYSPFGVNVYTVHFMEQFNDGAPSEQHQSIIVSEFGTENDIRYHISGTLKGARMKFKKEPWFNFVGRILNKWELRGFIVPLPEMSKPEALALFEAVMYTVDVPVVGNFGCKNCQTWVVEVLATEEQHCKVYVPVPAGLLPV